MRLPGQRLKANAIRGRVIALQQLFLYYPVHLFQSLGKTAQRVVVSPSVRNPFTSPPTRRW